jgi:SPP1 gp7 family putative phage head morphogenesis protein
VGPRGEADGRGGYADFHALAANEQDQAFAVIGVPQQVSAVGTLGALPIAASWLSDFPASEDGLDAWGARVAEDPAFTALIYRTLMMGDMGGQLFVRTVEVPESAPQRAVKLDRVVSDSFFNLPFEEAIQAFLERGLVTPEEYRRLSAEARSQAFSVSRMTSDELVKRVRDLLTSTLEDGGDYRAFVESVRSGEADLGVTATSSGYLENVFRTNTQSAYGAGRLRQITNPVVMAARPFVEYRTAKDSRVRPTHAQLEGVILRTDDPGFQRFNPPLGFQCRCSLVTRRAEDVDLSRVRDSSSLPEDAITPGFGR